MRQYNLDLAIVETYNNYLTTQQRYLSSRIQTSYRLQSYRSDSGVRAVLNRLGFGFCRKGPCPTTALTTVSVRRQGRRTIISPFLYPKLSHNAQNLTLLSALSMPGCVLLIQSLNIPNMIGSVSRSGCSNPCSSWNSLVSFRICSKTRFRRGRRVTGRERKVIKSRFRIRGSEEADCMKDW